MKLYVKIALAVVLFIAVAGILAALIMYNKKHPDTSKTRPDFVITAAVLQKEFEDNEKDASARYINKILEVTGTISSVTPADSTHFNISLKTGSDLSSVICTFQSKEHQPDFVTGKEITLRGECSGFLMDVLLNNCSEVPVRKR
jgi:hypothetical protein